MPLFELLACESLARLPLAAGEVMPLDAASLARLFNRALHLLFAIALGGGVFYLRAVLAPAGGEQTLFGGRRQVWARWVAIASTILIATGLYSYMTNIRASKSPGADPLPSAYHMLFGIKFLIALVVMFIASLVAGKSAGAQKARASAGRWLNFAWIAVIAIVIIGGMLRGMH